MPELSASVSASFADPDAFGGGRLLWETEDGTPPIGTDIARLYPATGLNGLRVRTNIGNVYQGGYGEEEITEVVQFGGGISASTRYPVVSLISHRNFGLLFDKEGNSVTGSSAIQFPNSQGGTTTLNFGGNRNGVTCNIGIYGAMEVTYRTNWYSWFYEPLIEVIPGAGNIQGVRITKGFIGAFENGNVATYEVPLGTVQEFDNKEIYRIVSEAVINEDGAYEKPEGWTGQAGSPTFSNGEPDPSLASITHERVHEVGAVTPAGSFFTKRYAVRTEQPYVGSFSYRPDFQLKLATPGQNGVTEADLSSPAVQAGIEAAKNRFGI